MLPLTASRYATASFSSIEVRPGRPAAGLYRMREPTPPALRTESRRSNVSANAAAGAAITAMDCPMLPSGHRSRRPRGHRGRHRRPIAGEPMREAAMAAFARSSKRFLAAN